MEQMEQNMDLVTLEQRLIREKIRLRGNRERAAGPKAGAMAATALDQFYNTLAIFQQHGLPELKAVIERVREY